jgi:hypothetical protein
MIGGAHFTPGLNECAIEAAGRGQAVAASSEPHLSTSEIGQIRRGRAALEVDFEVHRREIRRRTPLEKRVPLCGR